MKTNKHCNKCNQIKGISEFGRRLLPASKKYSVKSHCKQCCKKIARKYYLQHQKDAIDKQRQYYAEHREEMMLVMKSNYRKNYVNRQEYRKNNKDKIAKAYKQYYKNNKAYMAFIASVKRSNKKTHTPKWVDKEKIALVYLKAFELGLLTGLKYNVDHIYPLKNKNVSGLHVWENLQVLEQSLNFHKSNKNITYLEVKE
jgi:hypothetical protein